MSPDSTSTTGISFHGQFFRIPSPFAIEHGQVLLLEPPSARTSELRTQLLEERYTKPFVVDDGERRYLYFNVRLMQSAMALKAPNALDLRYTQAMMSFLLFQPSPKRIVQIGLGGGSLVKFCHHRLPGAHVTAVELNPDVIAFREAFLVPPDGPRLAIIEADGADFLARTPKGIDTLLVDAFDESGFAPSLANHAFLSNIHALLSGQGILVINLAGERERYAGLIRDALDVFDQQVIVFPVPEDGNHILLGFRQSRFDPRWRRLHNHAKELRAQFGLDFPGFAHTIERAAKLGYARREAQR